MIPYARVERVRLRPKHCTNYYALGDLLFIERYTKVRKQLLTGSAIEACLASGELVVFPCSDVNTYCTGQGFRFVMTVQTPSGDTQIDLSQLIYLLHNGAVYEGVISNCAPQGSAWFAVSVDVGRRWRASEL